MNNLAAEQRAYDNQQPPAFYAVGSESNPIESAATAALEAMQRGVAAEKLPLSGIPSTVTVQTLLTWIDGAAAELLLAACAQALKPGTQAQRAESDQACGALLRSFAARVAAEYASDNAEVYQ